MTTVQPSVSFVPNSAVDDRSSKREPVLRLLDLTIGIVAILIFGPLMIALAIIIYASNPGPIFFVQQRIGLNGKSFACFKFRTMVVDAQERLARLLEEDPAARLEWARDHKLRSDPRITSVGRFLRKSSFDELPQFFNLINGTMSAVGPRPIVHAEIARYGRWFGDYCRVKPGITGLWQVSGRSDTTYRRRVALDVAYSRHRSIGLNFKIMLMTIPAVLAARGSR
jgi:exopolysaccharide production protein ExoY